jgi:hypothetical protein
VRDPGFSRYGIDHGPPSFMARYYVRNLLEQAWQTGEYEKPSAVAEFRIPFSLFVCPTPFCHHDTVTRDARPPSSVSVGREGEP